MTLALAAGRTSGSRLEGTISLRIGFILLAVSFALHGQQTSTVLTTPANTAVFGQAVTLTATTTPSPSSGRVTFYDGAVVLGTSTVGSGKATFTTSLLATGMRSLRAYFAGAEGFSASTSGSVGVTVMSLAANGFLPPSNFPIGGNGSIVIGDFNGDGKADCAVAGVSVLLGNGDGTFTAPINTPSPATDVAVGDFNGDGKSDLAFTNFDITSPNNDRVGIMLGNGDGTFQKAISYPISVGPYLVVGDFNGDGKSDVAAIGNDGNVIVLLGNGDGTLQSAVSYPTGIGPETLVAADFNGDGKVDIAVVGIAVPGGSFPSPVSSVRVLLGNGDGTFQTPTTGFNTSAFAERLVSGDFNGDGVVDLATATNTGAIGVLLGVGNGTFQPAVNYSGGDGSSLAVADLNGDGKLDLVFSNFTGAIGALYGNGDGTFQFGLSFGVPGSDNSFAAADFNGDGKVDLIFDISNTHDVSVVLGEVRPVTSTTLTTTPNPSKLGQSVTLTALVSPSSLGGVVTFYDAGTPIGSNSLLNGQATLTLNSLPLGTHSLTASYPGDTQYVASTSLVVTQTVSGVLPPANVTLSPSASVTTFGQALKLTAVVFPASATGSVTFYDGTSILGTRAISGGETSLLANSLSTGAHTLTARYIGDNSNAPAISATVAETVVPVPGFGFGNSTLYPTGVAGSFAVAVGDFNGDGKVDLVTANPDSPSVLGNISVLLGKGDGTFQPAVNYTAGTYTYSVATGDFNGDGKMDVVAATAEGVLYVFLGNGDGTFPAPVPYSLGLVSGFVAVADFNGDGKPDLVASGNSVAGAKILLGNGDGSFQSAITASSTLGELAGVADFNGDGKPDLISYSGVALGNGDGTFRTSLPFIPGPAAEGLAIGDFNRDGQRDVAIALGGGAVVVLLGKGDGTFRSPVSYPGGAGPEGLAAADVDGDGNVDLVITDFYGGVTIFLGKGDGTFTTGAALAEPNGALAVAVGDFNGDGRADFAIANRGGGVNVFVNLVASQLRFTSIPTNGLAGAQLLPISVQVLDANGNPFNTSAPVTLTSTPAGVSATVAPLNGVANFLRLVINTPGVYTVTATSPGAQPVTSGSFTIASSAPSVAIDYPGTGAILASETFVITGWAMDSINQIGTAISSVKVLLDGTVMGAATYGINRPDVCTAYPQRPGCPNVGYRFSLFLAPGNHTITVTATDSDALPDTGSASIAVTVLGLMPATKVGIFRNNTAFLEDTPGEQQYDSVLDRYFTTFSGPGGFVAGDIPVTGDWTGDGHAKVGIYRSSTGQWFLDANNDFILDPGDYTYAFGGLAGDLPFVGDWMATGKSCVGIYRPGGSVWLLDLNCNGVFEDTPTDAFFPFGGLAGDVPVVGAWTGGGTRVGVVRKYAPGGVPQGNPFFWVPDGGAANAGNLPANHPSGPNSFGFGGLAGDVFVTGDWYNTGVSTAGVYRAGLWVLDAALPGAPQVNHVPGLAFGFGGVAGDVPLTGKW